ncbi:hypothetical protein J7T55_014019 [Diaporthe amygdali]|uniref:uncharacterized protein n=1 Tax=Phomopsis amygdali TaxID=1214568 RepID=UPI0022FE0740|nr:uncharacterized protein J7T55_014019 [Diaporthe amygdali]KAJ0119814.1 hypothetical protein J7T55_014019 [Diaporthe amygdali]
MSSISPDSHILTSTMQPISFGEPTETDSFVLTTPSSTTSTTHLGTTAGSAYLGNGSQTIVSSSAVTSFFTTGGYLNLGSTTSTLPDPGHLETGKIADSPTPTSRVRETEDGGHEITLPGMTSVYQSTQTLSPEVHQDDITVIRQTETWPSSKATLERTMTDSSGRTVVQTVTTNIPGETSVLETLLTMRPGETLVAIPKVISTIRGGITQIIQATYVDAEGHTTTSSYESIIGGQSGLVTRTYFVATSLPPGYKVITMPTYVPTTEGGTIEALQTTYIDGEGHLRTSSYTRTIHGTPTLKTVPIVLATPVQSGDRLTTLSTVIPTTIGGSTEVIETTFTNSEGQLTTSSYTTVRGGTPASTTVLTVIATPASTSSATSNGTQNTGNVNVIVYGLGLKEYMLGAFLPTILAAIIAYPFKLININARLMQPFHTLATASSLGGASPESSIFLRFYNWSGALSLPRSIKFRQPIIVISDLLVFGAALLAPIAAETVSVRVPDGCDLGCFGSLGVTTIPGRFLEALMAIMMALLMALIILLNVFQWKTGVSHNPWSIAGMASLSLNLKMRDSIQKMAQDTHGFPKEDQILESLAESKYALDGFCVSSNPRSVSTRGYGIIVRTNKDDTKSLVKSDVSTQREKLDRRPLKKNTQPFVLLTWWGRCCLLFVFACVFIILTYYENTSISSGFERFMDSRGFGVRFFFTALGVIFGACMETFFRSVAIISPYQQLSKQQLPAERSILLSPPTNAFYGMYSAFQQRSPFLGAVSFTTVLAELFLPVTLSHVPFSHLDTYETQLVCAWFSITILALMILVIVYSFFIQWPHMPVDPRTIVGAMFYVSDSWMLSTMEGMSTLRKKDRDRIMRAQRFRYGFGYAEGTSGNGRTGLNICGEVGEAAVMIRDEKSRYG